MEGGGEKWWKDEEAGRREVEYGGRGGGREIRHKKEEKKGEREREREKGRKSHK